MDLKRQDFVCDPIRFLAGPEEVAKAVKTAGEDLKAHTPVTLETDGTVKAVTAKTVDAVYGLTTEAVATGQETVIYLSGSFFAGTLVLPAGVTAALLEAPMRKVGIYLEDVPTGQPRSGEDRIAVIDQDETLDDLGKKKISELIGPDVKMNWEGLLATPTGTSKKVTEWNEWGTAGDLPGHFLPLELGAAYKGKPITMVGTKTKTVTDTRWVLKIDGGTVFTCSVEGALICKIDTSKMTLEA